MVTQTVRHSNVKVTEHDNLMKAFAIFDDLKDFPPVKVCKHFTGKESFDAVNAAREHAKKLGYSIGSMCSDAPIALAKGMDYIAKWYNIERSDWPRIQGLLLSHDFRDGEVLFVEF